MAFRSMIDIGRFRSFRESILIKLRDQVCSIALKKDTVIPANGIVNTMISSTGNKIAPVEVWDFPYPYSHENPFPIFNNESSAEVDSCFERLITKAGLYLA
jgi:hypothetical protein